MKTNVNGAHGRLDERRLANLADALARTSDPGTVLEFLWGLLTPSERARIGLRWDLVKRLECGRSQRRIARELGISLCKITRGSRELKRGPSGFRRVVAEGLRLDSAAPASDVPPPAPPEG